ncbi:MAG: hypothetical protein ABIV94_09515 [Acidimicrobiales bacterium]
MVVVPCGFLVVGSVIMGLVVVAFRQWSSAADLAVVALGAYWFAAGAWLRTPWGNVATRTPPPGPPELSDRHAALYAITALACVITCAVALAGQALVAGL